VGIIAIIKEALRIARAHKSLWLFGFLVGVGGGFNFGGGGGQPAEPPAVPPAPPELETVLVVALITIAVIIGLVILKFLSTGALIEGVRRARSNGSMTVGEGFREGWAHWGVLLRIALLYAAVAALTMVLLGGSCWLVWRAFGEPAVFVAAGLAVIAGLPLLVTLTILQAFAERIAVFENRRALDAIRKARLFLHGRLLAGLKLLVAALLGVLFVGALSLVVILPVGGLIFASYSLWGVVGAVALGVLTLLPIMLVVIAIFGVVNSSIWTIGYLTQVEQ
jgi:hypothetical protein